MSYLQHHGILGMRWGKRNGPPYPLEPSAHSAREKRLAKTGSGSKRFSSSESSNRDVTTKKKGLTKGQKTAIKVGAAIAVTALAAAGGYALYKSGKLNPLIEKGKAFIGRNSGENALQKLKDTSGAYQSRTAVGESYKINPKYTEGIGYQRNCAHCAVAYEYRRRGYLVQPSQNAIGRTNPMIRKAFTNIPKDAIKTIDDLKVSERPVAGSALSALYDEDYKAAISKRADEVRSAIVKEISTYPPGSRGIFNLTAATGGHEMAWEITKSGQVKLLNPQYEDFFSNDYYKPQMDAFFGNYVPAAEIAKKSLPMFRNECGVQIIRTDQLELSDYGKRFLTDEDGNKLAMSTAQIATSAAKKAGAAAATTAVIANKIKKKEDKKK